MVQQQSLDPSPKPLQHLHHCEAVLSCQAVNAQHVLHMAYTEHIKSSYCALLSASSAQSMLLVGMRLTNEYMYITNLFDSQMCMNNNSTVYE